MNQRQKRERRHAAYAAKHAPTIEDAINALTKGDPAHWTKAGRPDANVLSERLGRFVSAAERDEAWEAMNNGD